MGCKTRWVMRDLFAFLSPEAAPKLISEWSVLLSDHSTTSHKSFGFQGKDPSPAADTAQLGAVPKEFSFFSTSALPLQLPCANRTTATHAPSCLAGAGMHSASPPSTSLAASQPAQPPSPPNTLHPETNAPDGGKQDCGNLLPKPVGSSGGLDPGGKPPQGATSPTAEPCRMCRTIHRAVQMCRNAHRAAQMCITAQRAVQMCRTPHRSAQMCRATHRAAQMC